MSRERWATFSVRDHTRDQPFAADVLIYDRLLIPRPGDSTERDRWSKAGWAPKKLESILSVLRADEKDSPKRHAIPVPWNQSTRELFRQRAQTANIVNKEANYGLTARLLATELRPRAPEGVIPVAVIAAYPSMAAAKKEWISNEDQRRKTLTIALAHRFLVPEPKGKSDIELLQEAVDLADEAGFRAKRAQMYKWQDDVLAKGISDADALEEMAQYVDEYNVATKKAVRKVYTKFAFTLIPVGISALGGPLAPAVAACAVANLVRFWIFDRKPVVEAGDSQAAAMFHTIKKELGWRVADQSKAASSVPARRKSSRS